jgi:hypothetical protein
MVGRCMVSLSDLPRVSVPADPALPELGPTRRGVRPRDPHVAPSFVKICMQIRGHDLGHDSVPASLVKVSGLHKIVSKNTQMDL